MYPGLQGWHCVEPSADQNPISHSTGATAGLLHSKPGGQTVQFSEF